MATPDQDLIADVVRWVARDAGEPLRLAGVESRDLPGGFVSASVRRHDLTLVGAAGGRRTLAVVEKACAGREIAVLEAIQELAAPTSPALLASRADGADGRFISLFYPGPDLTFGDPAPLEVAADLARLHALWEGRERPAWAWTFDEGHLLRLHAGAVAALERSTRFEVPPPLAALHAGSPLFAVTPGLPPTLVHGDVHAGNIIARPDGGFTLIDWGNACWAPAMLDAANMMPLGSPAWSAYLAAYAAAGGGLDEAALTRAWRWARGATGLMYLPWAAEHRDDVSGLVAQVLEADAALAAPGGAPLT